MRKRDLSSYYGFDYHWFFSEGIDATLAHIRAQERILDLRAKEFDDAWDYQKSWDDYQSARSEINAYYDHLSRWERVLKPYTLEPFVVSSWSGSINGLGMSLEEFVDDVDNGGFIDYDGYGVYVKDGMRSEVIIYPSDIYYNAVRKDFDRIRWFNR